MLKDEVNGVGTGVCEEVIKYLDESLKIVNEVGFDALGWC